MLIAVSITEMVKVHNHIIIAIIIIIIYYYYYYYYCDNPENHEKEELRLNSYGCFINFFLFYFFYWNEMFLIQINFS